MYVSSLAKMLLAFNDGLKNCVAIPWLLRYVNYVLQQKIVADIDSVRISE